MTQKPAYLKSLKKESVVQSVINRLTDAIRNGELKPGDRIPAEPDLAESLGVARSSVREAIKILTYLGVLESKRAEGTFVCSGFKESMIDPMVYGIILNQDSFQNLMELREMTEAGMMKLAIEKHSKEDMKELEQRFHNMEKVLQNNDENAVNDFFEADNAFHDEIAKMARNPMADKINRVVRTLTYSIRLDTVQLMLSSGRGQELLDAHKVLLDTLENSETADLSQKLHDSYFEATLSEHYA